MGQEEYTPEFKKWLDAWQKERGITVGPTHIPWYAWQASRTQADSEIKRLCDLAQRLLSMHEFYADIDEETEEAVEALVAEKILSPEFLYRMQRLRDLTALRRETEELRRALAFAVIDGFDGPTLLPSDSEITKECMAYLNEARESLMGDVHWRQDRRANERAKEQS